MAAGGSGPPKCWPRTRPNSWHRWRTRSPLSAAQEYEEAARLRDEAERLRHLLGRHRRVESLRRAGRVVLLIDGEGTVELDGGLLTESGVLFGDAAEGRVGPGHGDSAATGGGGAGRSGGSARPAAALAGDGHDNERIIVAQWLHANAASVRVLEVESTDGMSMPADRIPTLLELCSRRHG